MAAVPGRTLIPDNAVERTALVKPSMNWIGQCATNGMTGRRSQEMRAGQFLTETLVACAIGVSGIGAAAAGPAGPPGGYTIEPKYTRTSPDGAVTIEQYVNKDADVWKWQFWARRQDTFTQLGPQQDNYPAGFVFTNDLKWIIRTQKTGSGEASLYLYRLGPHGFVAAT